MLPVAIEYVNKIRFDNRLHTFIGGEKIHLRSFSPNAPRRPREAPAID